MKKSAEKRSRARLLKGEVVSDKMDKTVVVAVTRLKKHSKYKQRFRITKRYKAHDEENASHVGDVVLIQETRSLSKEKRWKVINRL